MELDAPVDSQQLDGIAPSPITQPTSGKDGAKDPERFYCPYPGCNRSFAELWRLKVHFRAPPDIRGSGKERGHGTELTHCPKCGKTLKPGKHHVGCSGSKTSARQANKRTRVAGEAELPDEAPTSSHLAKHVKGDVDMEPLVASWPDYARSHTLHSLTLQPALKQEQQEWTTMQPGIIYGPNGTATACWLPGQLNGFVPQLSAQGYVQPQFPPELQFPGGAHGYPQQVPPFPSLPGYPQPGPILAEPGQVLSLPNPNGNLQPLAGMPAVGLPGTGPVLFHQQPHTHMEHPQSQQAVATSLEPPAAALQALPNSQQQPQQLLNEGSREGQQQLAGRVAAEQGVDAGVDGVACAATATATRGNGTAAAAAGVLPVPGSPTPQLHQQHQQQHQQHSQHQTAIKATNSDDSLGSAFGDVEEFTRDFGRIPSPPPLPADFHSAANGGTNGMLFNFAQFSQKLPRSQSQTRLDKNLSAVGLGLDNGLDADLLYDHSDDGDLMQLLFGVPDELPTMATIHLHKWSNGDEEEEEVLEPGGNGGERSGLAAATAAAGPGPSSSGRVGGGDADGALSHPFDRTSSHVVEGTTTAAVTSQQQHHHQPGEESVVGTPVLAAGEEQQPHQQRHEHQHQQGQSGVINLKTELLLDGHLHEPGPEPYLVHGGSVGGGKVALGQLVNGLSSNQSHPGDEHHRDHLLDAETFRLLQSCD